MIVLTRFSKISIAVCGSTAAALSFALNRNVCSYIIAYTGVVGIKRTKLTPGSNLLWESSRMILPEHKEAMIRHREEITVVKPKRPVRDEFELEELAGRLQDAMEEGRELVFTIWGRETPIRGRVVKMDADTKKVHIQNFGTVDKVPFLDILAAERPEF